MSSESLAPSVPSRRGMYWIAGVAAVLMLSLLAAFWVDLAAMGRVLADGLGPMWQTLRAINPTAFILLAAVLVLEKLFPAKPNQRVFSVGFAQDLVWYFLSNAAKLFIVAYWIAFLRNQIFEPYLGFLEVKSAASWPLWVKFALGLLGLDLLGYFHHWVHHRFAWTWYFHAIHHSQREMNLFTDFRVHVGEHIIAWSVKFIPAMALGLSNPEIFYMALILAWHSHLVHANVKTNFGPLKYILVTPQSHRVHHSREREHFDVNYGIVFSFWDHLFGTQCRDYEVYPETGINDPNFPHEKSYRAILFLPILQLLYPFRRMVQSLKRPST